MIPPSSTFHVFVFFSFSFFLLCTYIYLSMSQRGREGGERERVGRERGGERGRESRERERNHEGNEMRLCLISMEFLPYHTYIQVAITAHHASSGGRTSHQSRTHCQQLLDVSIFIRHHPSSISSSPLFTVLHSTGREGCIVSSTKDLHLEGSNVQTIFPLRSNHS